MPIERKPYPYELLRRYNKDGTLRGAHFKALICLEEDGVTIDEKEGDAQPVAAGITALGLDLAALLGQETAALQLTVEQQAETIAAHEATIKEQAAQLAERAPVQEELDAAHANIQALMARLAEVETAMAATDSATDEPASAADSAKSP